eukprot:6177618-Pleurochrysis_carterae.AAC.3
MKTPVWCPCRLRSDSLLVSYWSCQSACVFPLRSGSQTVSQVILASSSKFPAALAIAGAVADGHLSFDTRAYELLEWWSSAADDLRSGVTLRHLLTFTSGLVSTDFGGAGIACLDISPLSNASKLSAESWCGLFYCVTPVTP